MSHVTRDEVERIAILARLSLSDAEAERARAELEAILAYVELLGQLDTEGVEPTSHVLPLATPLREDLAALPLEPEVAVANAPESDGSAFVVPKVIAAEEEG
jgi:aspartyl-tRNA(Asn)/glutamyl-tRNA(Gln) amidotransferase subunit C